MKQWYALRSKPRREQSSAYLLARAGIETFVPQIKVRKKRYEPPAVEPLFPGYLFGYLDPEQGEIRLAEYTSGIQYVVGFGGEPSPVPEALITSIRERLADPQHYGWLPDFKPGDRVVIQSGPLRDVEAVFDRRLSATGRVHVLIRLMERFCRAELDVTQLRRAS